jgi:alkanesulfonate monooxygenase SsuD/methylene tetrahydromethanopterin reductase-like flavin-dependent oxidoreductase (luciferase family)
MPVSVGIMLPSRETAMTGLHDARGLIAFARAAEDAGFDSVWVGGLTGRADACGAVVSPCRRRGGDDACGAGYRCVDRAAAASSAGGGAGGDRRPALSWPTDPRAPLGASPPESRREFDAVGMPFSGRGARLDKTVTLWRETWNGQGEFADALPPARQGGPPVWLASGDATKVIERGAATYDGWLPYLPDVNAYARAWDRIRSQAVREVAPALYATVNLSGARADDELDEYLRAYYSQPLDVMRYVQAIRGGSVAECLDWLARYVEAGALHLILRIGSLTAGPESVAEQLLPALKEIG